MTLCNHGPRRRSPGPGPTLVLGALVLASAALAGPASAARRQGRPTGSQASPAPTRTVYLRVPHRHVVTTYHYHRVLVRRSDGRVLAVGPAFQLVRSQGSPSTTTGSQATVKSPATQLAATKTPAAKSTAPQPAAAKPAATQPAAAKPGATQLAAAKPSAPPATVKAPVSPGAVVKPSPVASSYRSARRRRSAGRRPRWIRALIGGRR